MSGEGVIKFKYKCKNNFFLIPENIYTFMNPVREELKQKNFIGEYPDGLSYGNISMRDHKSKEFYISASDTGKFEKLDRAHYVKIISCSIENNLCFYKGVGLPSSEALSHFIIYENCPDVNSIIHIHDKTMWTHLKDLVPTSSPEVAYGTVDMVNEIINLLKYSNLKKEKILVMGGHEDGLISFGSSINEAYLTLIKRIF